MAGEFDPDAFLAEKTEAFDPDAFLAEPVAPAPAPVPPPAAGGFEPHEAQGGYSSSDGIELADLPRDPRRLSDPYAGQRAQYEFEQKQREDLVRQAFEFTKDPGLTEGQVNLKIAQFFGVPEDVVQHGREKWLKEYAAASGDPKAWIRDNPLSAQLLLDHPEKADHIVNNKEMNVLLQGWNAVVDLAVDLREQSRKGLPTDNLDALSIQQRAEDAKQIRGRAERDAPRPTVEVDDAEAARIREGGVLAISAQRAKEAQADLNKSRLWHKKLVARTFGKPTFWIEQDIHRAEMESTPKYLGETGWQQALSETVGNSVSTVEVAKSALKKGGVGAGVGGVVGFAAGAALRNPALAAEWGTAGANFGGKLGGAVGAADASFTFEAGSSYEEFSQLRTADGQPLTDAEARGGALIAATVKTGIELAELTVLLKALGPAGEALSGGGAAAVREALATNPGFRTMAVRALKAWAAEGGEEVAQDAVDQATGYLLRSKHAETFQPEPVFNVARLKDNLVGGLMGGALFGAGGFAVTVGQHAIADAKGARAALQAPELAKLAGDPTVQGMAGEVARLVTAKTSETGDDVTHVHIDPKAILRFFQGDETKANEKAVELLGETGPQQMAGSLLTGQHMAVPLQPFFAKTGKDLAAAIADDMTTQAGAPTPRQVKEKAEANEKWAQELAKGEAQSETLERFDALEAQLAATGTHSPSEAKAAVTPLRQVFLTFAKKFGQTTEDLFRGVRLSVNDGTATLEVLRKQSNVSEVLSKELHDGLAPEERAKRLYVDPVTNLGTRRAFDETPRTAGRQVAVITSPDIKALNDHVEGGHDTANELLRTIGNAVSDVDPNAARSGTNFLFEVDSLTHLNLILDRLRKALPDAKLGIEGASAATLDDAFKKLDADTTEKRRTDAVKDEKGVETKPAKKATLPARGETNFDLSKLKEFSFPAGKPRARVSAELVNKAGLLSKEDFFREAYQDKQVPGILNGTAWGLIPRKAHVASIDIRGLKTINGPNGVNSWIGDKLLKQFAQVLERNDGSDFDFAHLSGDEYAAQHDDPVKLKAWLDHVRAELAKSPIKVEDKGTGEFLEIEAEFRSGIGEKTYGAADRALNRAKAEEKRLRDEGKAAADQPGGSRPDVDVGRSLSPGGRRKGYERHGAARQGFIGKEVVGPDRLAQFPTPEESLRAAQAFATFLDAAREQGAKPIAAASAEERFWATAPDIESLPVEEQEPAAEKFAKSRKNPVADWLFVAGIDRFQHLAEMLGVVDDDPDLSLGELNGDELKSIAGDATPNRQVWLDPLAKAAGGYDALAKAASGLLYAQAANEAAGGGFNEEVFPYLALELDNDPKTAGPESALIPPSRRGFKPLPGQKEIEEYLDQVNASKNRLFQEPTAEQRKAIALADDIRAALNKSGVQRLFATDDVGNAKGFTDIAREGIDAVYRVALTKNADKSTFLHESAHVFLDLFADLAERADAPKSVVEDWATTLKWLGVENRQGIKRDQHEKWAKAFETYVAEGKFPADRLAGAFQRFRLWMMAVYKQLQNVGGEVSEDIRGVFDRLLATDTEIDATKRRMGLNAMPREALGMDAAAYAEHLDELQKATSHAAQVADFQVVKDQLRATEDWWKSAKADAKKKAAEAYENLPARRAQQLLQGKPVGDFLGIKEPLNKAVVEAMVGEKDAKKFKTAKDGVHPDDIVAAAEGLLGYATGKDMLEAVLKVPEKETWVDVVADNAMREQFPGVLDERTRLREIAAQGLHGKATKQWVLKEYAALNAKASQAPGEMAPAEVLKRAADIMAAGLTADRLRPRDAQLAERDAANNAVQAATRGNFAQAAVFKRQQLLNMYLHDAIVKAKTEVEAIEKKAAQLAKLPARQRLGKADPKYRIAIDSLLATFDFTEPEQDAQSTNLDAALQEVEKLMLEDETPVAFDRARIVDRAARRGLQGWRQLPVEDLRQVRAAMDNIEAAARNRSTVLLDDKRADKVETIANLKGEAEQLERRPDDPTREAETLGQTIGRQWNALDGALLKPETLTRFLSGAKDTSEFLKSTWFHAIVAPMQRAKVRELDLGREVLRPLVDKFDEIPNSGRQMEKIDGRKLFPSHVNIEAPQRRFEILMMLLNMGNQSNIDRLTRGRNITEEQVRAAAVVVGITKEEYEWVQSVWDTAEKLKPLAFDLEEKHTGVRPDEITARPLVTPFGTFAGGYFPAVYSKATDVGARQEARLAQFKDAASARPSTTHNYLISRVEDFSDVLSLSPNTINRHFALVIHDVAFREAVQSVGGLLSNEEVRQTMRERMGDGRAKQLLQWVGDVAQMRGIEGMDKSGGLMRLATWMRGNIVPAVLGYKVPNALEDFTTNLLSAVPASDLHPKHLAAGIAEFYATGKNSRAMALEKSGELRSRQKQVQRELAKEVKDLTATGVGKLLSTGPVGWYKEHAFAFAEAVEYATATPIWIGAYRQALQAEKSEADAVTFADATVRQVVVSHNTVDLAPLMRDKGPIGFMTMFFGAFNHFYNQFRILGHDLGEADTLKTRASKAGRMLGLATGIFLVGALVRGKGPEKDEPEWEWLLRKMFLDGLMQMVPLVNIAGRLGDRALSGKNMPSRDNSLFGTSESIGTSLLKLADSDTTDEKRVKEFLKILGPTTGIPTAGPLQVYDALTTWALGSDKAN